MNQTTQTDKDSFGDRLVRHWVTLSSFSPLFFLVAILGIHVEITIFSSIYNVFGSLFDAEKLDLSFNSQWPVRIGCIILITLPYWQLKVLFLSRIDEDEKTELTVHKWNDGRETMVSYLFANLVPFYQVNIKSQIDLVAYIFALIILYLLFYKVRNYFFVPFFFKKGYEIGTVDISEKDNMPIMPILLSKRSYFKHDEVIQTIQLNRNIYIEV